MTNETNTIRAISQADSKITQEMKRFNSKFKTDFLSKLPFAGIIIIEIIMCIIFFAVSKSVTGLIIAYKGVFHIVLSIATIIFIVSFCWLYYAFDADKPLSEIQEYCKSNKFYLDSQARKSIYKPYLRKKYVCIGLTAAAIILIIVITIVINVILSGIKHDENLAEAPAIIALSLIFFLSHLIFCFSIANIHIVQEQLYNLKSYSCQCGNMFSFMSSEDYDHKTSTEIHEGKYGTREVTVGTAKVDNIDIRLYKNETYEKVAPSEWEVFSASWTDICYCCGKGKKRNTASYHKIRDL